MAGGDQAALEETLRRAMAAIVRLLNGEARALGPLAIDYRDASEFHRQVCEAARAIPPGETLTYGELAARLGKPGAARAVGGVMARNALPIIVPCHRVLAAGGLPGGPSIGAAGLAGGLGFAATCSPTTSTITLSASFCPPLAMKLIVPSPVGPWFH